MGPSAEDQVAAFQQAVAKSAAEGDRLELMQQEITAIEVTRSSSDRAVTVVAGPGGAIRSINFTESALGQSPQALGRVTTTTIQQAIAEAARKQAEIVQRYAGQHIDVIGRVTLLQDELFKEPAADGFQLNRSEEDSGNLMAAANDRSAWSEPRPQQQQQQFSPPPQQFAPAQPQFAPRQRPAFSPPAAAGPQFGAPPHQPPHQPQPQHAPRSRPADAEPEESYDFHMMDED